MEEQRYKYTIYKICCDDCDEIYVGSTRALARRKYQHKHDCNNPNGKSYNYKIYQTIRDNGGWTNWRMCPIEEIQNVSKIEAEIKEEEYRVILTANLNSKKASRGEITITEYQKQYQEHNSERLKEKSKEYRVTNKEKIAKTKKEYREKNSERLKEYQKEYYDQNKEQSKEYYDQNKEEIDVKKKQKIECDCGAIISNTHKSRHKKTIKHKLLMESKL